MIRVLASLNHFIVLLGLLAPLTTYLRARPQGPGPPATGPQATQPVAPETLAIGPLNHFPKKHNYKPLASRLLATRHYSTSLCTIGPLDFST